MGRVTFSPESVSGVHAFASLHSLVAGVGTFVYLLLTFRVHVLLLTFLPKCSRVLGA